jgi:hypothetical protein
MENRSWLWIGAAVLVAGAVFWGVGQSVGPSNGDVEFQKTLESMKQVKSFRGAYIEAASSVLHSQRLWEVDCNRVIVHQQSLSSQSGSSQSGDSQSNSDSPFEMKHDELLVGEHVYTRDRDGSWENAGDAGPTYSAKWYCDNLAQGTIRDLLPDILTMTRHAVIGKGDKKTVNGVRCREWNFVMRSAVNGQQGSVCIGVDDHLPYEMTMEGGGHFTYSDYNRPIQIEAPEAVLQSASSTSGP